MTQPAERVALECPVCSPADVTEHEVLTDGEGGHVTVRCTECDHVHKEPYDPPREVEREVVVSQEGESFASRLEAPAEETVAVGDEFIADTEEALFQVRVTSIEVGPEKRVEEATIEDAETIWTRVVDNVAVNVTVHPKDGRRDETRSLKVHVPGDYEFVVGEIEEFGNDEFEIEGIQVRQEASDYRFDKFDHEGDMVFAKDVKRLYARDQTTTAWSAW